MNDNYIDLTDFFTDDNRAEDIYSWDDDYDDWGDEEYGR